MSSFETMELIGLVIELDRLIGKKNISRAKKVELKIKIEEINQELKAILNNQREEKK